MPYFSLNLVYHPGLGVVFPSPSIGLGSRDELSSVVHDFTDEETDLERLEDCPRENGISFQEPWLLGF